MNSKKKGIVIFLLFFIFMFLIKSIAKNYTITITESLPLGVYKLSEPNNIKVEDIVQFQPEKETLELIYSRGYLPKYATTLLKEVAADYSNRDEIKIIDNYLYVSGKNYGLILNVDSLGREIKAFDIEQLKPKTKDEYLLLSSHHKSYDSRYFGLINKKNILKKAELKIRF